MKNLLAFTTSLGLLAITASTMIPIRANALTLNTDNIESLTSTITVPPQTEVETEQASSQKVEQLAYDYYYCEWDDYGNWACVYF